MRSQDVDRNVIFVNKIEFYIFRKFYITSEFIQFTVTIHGYKGRQFTKNKFVVCIVYNFVK